MRDLKGLSVFAALLAMLAAVCLSYPRDALAQAGSVGGAIGKQGKSVSGGDSSPPRAAPAPAPSRKRTAAVPSGDKPARAKGGSACGQVAGVWTANGWWNGIYGRGDVVLSADGSARHNSGIIGRWTCNQNRFSIDWKDWASGQGTLSDDGNTVTLNGGGTMTRGH